MTSLLSKKVAIVTGASSGIGKAIALMFASRGAKVTVCGQDQERLKYVFDQAVEVSGGNKDTCLIVQGDLNDKRIRKEIVDQTVEKFGSLDILVANAGVTQAKQSVMTATEETYNLIMDTNLKSVFFLIQQAVPHLEKSKGNIVNISSTASCMSSSSTTLYSMSKAALDHLTRCLASDLGPKGIRANVVNPGFIPTLILRYHGNKRDMINYNIRITEVSQQALNKDLTFQDITEAVAFLSSDAAAFITGESLRVDGGRQFGGPVNWSAPTGKIGKNNN